MIKSTVEIRKAFLDFFHNKGHQIVASSSLIANNDPTLLFTNAGMNQFKDIFLGLNSCNYSRVVTAQRCLRVGGKHNDLRNVGYTARHHTFFEMLGNFSFGDYFKHDAIQYAWELLTSKNWFNLPKERLWVTVYESDDESYEIWEKEVGISCERIVRVGDNKNVPYSSDNFWKMGETGPCGPCTEIFYDHGDHIYGGPPGSTEENGDRYIEIWNIVFMQFNRQANGTMDMLPKLSVDTGMGLERIAAVLQHVNSNYEIDLFQMLIKSIIKIIGVTNLNGKSDKSLCVVADHIRSCAFLIADGVIPSNENLGYVLRRIIRRAIYHGYMLGAKEIFFYKLVEPLITSMRLVGNKLKCQQKLIEQVLKIEEKQFTYTLERGLALLLKELEKLKEDVLDGATVFRLYDTYGFPIDLTIDVCRKRNIKVDESGFEIEMEKQRLRARKSSIFSVDYNAMIFVDKDTKFEGYNHLKVSGKVISLFVDSKAVDRISIGQNAIVVLDKTPFYAESGGQIGDKGNIKGNDFNFLVSDTQRYGRAIGHIGKLTFGSLKVNQYVQAQVDEACRIRICSNHTAAHLMHAALRKVLGINVVQKGSLITDKMLRFDFSHFQAMKQSEIRTVEDLINTKIRCNLPVETTITDLDKIERKSTMALFGGKYDKHVRVLNIGSFSTELCGGTHVSFTGNIGLFLIVSESSIAAGIRRIVAVTGEEAIANLRAKNDQLHNIAKLFKSNSQNISKRVQDILKHIVQSEKEICYLKEQIAIQESMNLSRKTIEIKGVKLLVSELRKIEPKMLRVIVNNLKNQLGSSIIVLATTIENKISLIAGVSKDVTNRVKAEELVNMVAQKVKGKGGGCSEIAQAGGTDIALLPKALASVRGWVYTKL